MAAPVPQPVSRPDRPPATEGVHRLRVRYCECDPMGVVHHAAYVPWLEEARTELLRTSSVSYSQLESAGVFLAVVRLDVAYKQPGRYDDLVEVRTRVVGATRVKLRHEYEVRLIERAGALPDELSRLQQAGLDLLVTATTTLACLDAEGRPAPLPQWIAGGGGGGD